MTTRKSKHEATMREGQQGRLSRVDPRLRPYGHKRQFASTPEPPPSEPRFLEPPPPLEPRSPEPGSLKPPPPLEPAPPPEPRSLEPRSPEPRSPEPRSLKPPPPLKPAPPLEPRSPEPPPPLEPRSPERPRAEETGSRERALGDAQGRVGAGRAQGTAFVVHKHDARRLHYDLRLEIEGVLASWAIPKGPSYDPEVRRLAVQTEDHPLAYGDFEGRIPEGQYGAGDTIVWDRGSYQSLPPGQASEMRRKGHLTIELHGTKLHGRWHLVRTRALPGEEPSWLFFKGRDEFANRGFDVVAERPESVLSGKILTRGPLRRSRARNPARNPARDPAPRPSDLLDRLPRPLPRPLHPRKNSVLVAVSHGSPLMRDSDGHNVTEEHAEIMDVLAKLPVVDTVIRGHWEKNDGARDTRGTGRLHAVFCVSDLLWLDGESWMDRSRADRRDTLDSLLANAGTTLRLDPRMATKRLPP